MTLIFVKQKRPRESNFGLYRRYDASTCLGPLIDFGGAATTTSRLPTHRNSDVPREASHPGHPRRTLRRRIGAYHVWFARLEPVDIYQ
jgi:hypothetical protein